MKVIQTPLRFYPYKGGAEQLSFCLSRELVKRGHQVKVVCADEPPVGDLTIENIEVKRLPYIGKISDTDITLSLGKELLKEDFDILHTHLPHPWSADISALVSFIKNRPLFLTYHNDISGKGINKILASIYNIAILNFLLKRSSKVFITRPGYLEASAFLKPFMKKIVVTPPGVDLERFRPLDLVKQDNNIIFFLGILDKFHLYKGLKYLLLSVKKIMPKISLKIYIGGEGDLLDYYRTLVKENGLGNLVNFLGRLDDEQLLRYYNLCDVFVLPSISSIQEGFGLVALEAMACKKPVIITDIVGLAKDVRRYEAGMVVLPKDAEGLSQAIGSLLLNKDRCREMGLNAYNLVKSKYTWQQHADIVEKEYLEVMKEV